MAATDTWRLDLRGDIELVGPDGSRAALPYRKVGELLAALARKPGAALSRQDLARELWPHSSRSDRQGNLRQALAKLRCAIGADAIRSDRETCMLDPRFAIEVLDASRSQASSTPERDGPIASFGRMIQWLADRDVPALYAALRANPEYAISSPSRLGLAIRTADRQGPLPHGEFGWACLWRGYVWFASDIDEAVPLLAAASEHAMAQRDWLLLEHATFWHGIGLLLLNRIPAARRVARRAAAEFAKPGGAGHLYRLRNLEATIMLHEGRVAEALNAFEGLNGYSGQSTLERAADETLRAVYLAFNRRPVEASEILAQLRTTVDGVDCSRAGKYRTLAEVVLEAAEEDGRASARLEDAISDFASSGDRHFEIYCRETLARCYWNHRAKPDARHQLQKAWAIRRGINMSLTGWDRARLGDVPALIAAGA